MKSSIALLLGGLALALAIFASLRETPLSGGVPGSSLQMLSEKLDALSSQVEANAIQARSHTAAQQQLAGEVEILRAVLVAEASLTGAGADEAQPSAAEPPAGRARAVGVTPPARANAGLDVEALVAAGFSRDEVDDYQAYVDDIDMRRLRLRDQAEREGWLSTSRFLQQRQVLMAELAAQGGEFGDELRDWALYTSGVPNRVRVRQVLSGSPAASAGLQPGDVLLQYADSRVLRPGELRGLTSQGDVGAQTAITVLRGGDELRIYVPRGPLGVRLEPFRAQPKSPR